MNESHDNPPPSIETPSSAPEFNDVSAQPVPTSDLPLELTPVPDPRSGATHGFLSQLVSAAMPPMIAIIAWFIPGLGHLLLRRWQRAFAFFVAAGGLAVTGYLMRGNVFAPHSHDPFGTLGFIADASSGVFYLLAHILEKAGPDVARAMGDYGTRFIAGAGIVNMMGVCDAFAVARGRKF